MWQNVTNGVLLAWFKFQAKIPSCSRVCLQGEWQKYTPPYLPLSKDEGLKNIGHSMSIRSLIFGVNSVTVSYLIRYDSLLQNAKLFYYEMRQKFITKCVKFFITKCHSFITKCNSYYKMRRFYYKSETVITKCDVYYNYDSTKDISESSIWYIACIWQQKAILVSNSYFSL